MEKYEKKVRKKMRKNDQYKAEKNLVKISDIRYTPADLSKHTSIHTHITHTSTYTHLYQPSRAPGSILITAGSS